jgi:hypothetical protein
VDDDDDDVDKDAVAAPCLMQVEVGLEEGIQAVDSIRVLKTLSMTIFG